MSRSDQYVGLTAVAEGIVEELKKNPKNLIESCSVCPYAFLKGDVKGIKITTVDRIYQEELQVNPWSAGPMYFTRLAVYNRKKKNLIGYIGEWEEDETCEFEYDKDTGKYYV